MAFTDKQIEAIESFGENILVSAGAGSGKTTVLSERVMYLILHKNISISRMLILTFTENAAHSMKNKIKSKIKGGLDKNPSLKDELTLVDSSDIMTFDAFNRKLVKKYFYKLGIDKNFSIVNQSLLIGTMMKMIDEEFDKLYLNKDPVFYQMLDKFTVNDDKDIRTLVLNIILGESNSSDPEKDLSSFASNPLKTLDYLDEAYIRLAKEGKNAVKEFLFRLDECDDDDLCFANIKKAAQSSFANIDDAKNLTDVINMFDAYKGLKVRKKKGDSPFANTYQKIKDKFNKKLGALKTMIPSEEKTEKVYKENSSYLSLLYNMAFDVYKKINLYKKEKGLYEFHDIALMALHLLSDDKGVAKEVAESYDEIMVDEYQDNNDLQEEFLSYIGRNNLFMVGDVKQSIYGFRNSKPKYFMDRFALYKNHNGGKLICMNDNFRSTNYVITDINNIFSRIMTSSFGGADYRTEHQINAANRSLDNALPLYTKEFIYSDGSPNSSPNLELEAKIIADDIISRIQNKELIGSSKKEADFSSFCILCDRGNDFDKIGEIFKKRHIPLRIEVNSDVISQPIIILVKSLFILYGCILNKDFSSASFKHALMVITRGPLMKYSNKKIDELFRGKDFINDKTVKVMENIVESTSSKDILSIYLSIIDGFDVYGCIKDFKDPSASYSFLMAYLSVIQDMAKLNYTIDDAIDYFKRIDNDDSLKNKLQISSSFSNSVTLTNIHKSKGLEYEVVYYIGLSRAYNEEMSKERFVFDPKYGVMLPMVVNDFPIEDRGSCKNNVPINPFKYEVNLEKKDKDNQEKVRLLYVALTRAQYQMIFLEKKESNSKNLFSIDMAKSFMDLLYLSGFCGYHVKIDKDEAGKLSSPYEEEGNVGPGLFSYVDYEGPVIENKVANRASKLVSHADKKTLDFGTYLHKCLECVDIHSKDVSFIKDEKAKKLVVNFLSSDLIKKYGSYDDYHEYVYFDKDSGTSGSVDLLLVGENDCVIIDYKLKNIDDEAYVRQLDLYKKNMESIFLKPCKCFIYSILTSTVKEIC